MGGRAASQLVAAMRPHLDLYKERRYRTVKLSDKKEYRLPNEYSVEEVERVLELQAEIKALEDKVVVGAANAENADAKRHTELVFAQLEVMFQHYQPDLDAEYLRKVMTHREALEIIGFIRKYRHIALRELREEEAAEKADSKKKSKLNPERDLRELRRMVTFMVTCGFSLFEVKKLYIDEAHDYYYELVYHLEQEGKLKSGSYDKIKSRSKPSGVADTVALLRKQMFKSIADSKRKK